MQSAVVQQDRLIRKLKPINSSPIIAKIFTLEKEIKILKR